MRQVAFGGQEYPQHYGLGGGVLIIFAFALIIGAAICAWVWQRVNRPELWGLSTDRHSLDCD